jgi:hypothetical protein
MDQINGTQYMYKTKLVIPSTQTDILPQHKLFLCGYAVLNHSHSRGWSGDFRICRNYPFVENLCRDVIITVHIRMCFQAF